MKKIFTVIMCVFVCYIVGFLLFEPKICPLCQAEQTDAPCIIDLHTGEIGEIRIGNGELSDDPSSAVFYLVDIAGCDGYCDTGTRCCHLALQRKSGSNRWFMYCRSCRANLYECRHCRYAILDLRQPEVVVYPAAGEFCVGEYQISISTDQTMECRLQS